MEPAATSSPSLSVTRLLPCWIIALSCYHELIVIFAAYNSRGLWEFYPDGPLRHKRAVSAQIRAQRYLWEKRRKECFRFVLSQKDWSS